MEEQQKTQGASEIARACNRLRDELLSVETAARALKKHPGVSAGHDPGEANANVMLAVRHIEDARMRLGKVIQHCRDGISAFDNPAVKAVVSSLPMK